MGKKLIIWTVLLALSVCITPLTHSTAQTAAAKQETPAAAPSESNPGGEAAGKEDTEAAERARQRRRFQTTTAAQMKVGDKSVSMLAGILKTSGADYQSIASLKDGDILLLTHSQSIKLKTDLNLAFDGFTAKTENVAENYPGVYSLWLKRSGDGWRMVFNEKPDLWGTMHDAAADVGEISVAHSKLDPATESLAFALDQEGDGGILKISFGEHQWSAKFKIVQ